MALVWLSLVPVCAFAACAGSPGHPVPALAPAAPLTEVAATAPMPRYTVAPDLVALGDCLVGELRSAEFTLETFGPQPMELLAEVACACQELQLDGMPCARTPNGLWRLPLAPGRSVLRVDVKAPKPGSKGLAVRLFDGQQVQVLGLSLHARDELRVEPSSVELGEIARGALMPFEAVIVADDGRPFELTQDSLHGAIERAELVRESPSRWRVRGSVNPALAGRGTAEVRLRSDRKYSDWVYVTVQWSAPIGLVAPASIRLPDVRPGSHAGVTELMVTTPVAASAPVASIEGRLTDGLAIEGPVREQVDGDERRSHFRLRVLPAASGGFVHAAVVLRAAGEVVGRVPVTGRIRR
jgi:hypothetical protein